MTFAEIVADYIRTYRPIGQAEDRFFKSLASLADAISHAVRPDGRKDPHQYRIPSTVLDEAKNRLQKMAPDLAAALDFVSLHGLVEHSAGSVSGIGDLAIYDIAHRIGMYVGKAPHLVYLHRGARQGAALLGVRGRRTLDPTVLPPAFSSLTAAEIEDCLCIYKRKLVGDGSSGRSQRPSSRCSVGGLQKASVLGRRQLGVLCGRLKVPNDFDTELPEAVLRAFEGR